MPNRERRPRQRICQTHMVCLVVWLSFAIGMVLDRLELSPTQLSWTTFGFGQQTDKLKDRPDTSHHGPKSRGHEIKKDLADLQPQKSGKLQDNKKGDRPWSSSLVPYDGDTVMAKPLDSNSVSMTGRACGDKNCTHVLKGNLCSLCLTQDNRLLVMSWVTGILHVHSAAGVHRIQFTSRPFSLTQLPNGLLAMTCPSESSILLVDIDAANGVVDVIETKRKYFGIVLGFEPNTFIVSSPRDGDAKAVVDVVNMKGEVLKTLADNELVPGMDDPISLTRTEKDVLVCALSDQGTDSVSIMVGIGQSHNSSDNVHIYTDELLWSPMETSVDRAGNIFIAQFEGAVMVRSKNGRYRSLLEAHDERFPYSTSVVVHKDRLLVAWRQLQTSSTLLVEYKLSSDVYEL